MRYNNPEATALAKLAHENRAANGDCRPVKPRIRLKYQAPGYTNGVPNGAIRSATRTGFESKSGPNFEAAVNPDINSGAFSRLQSQINRTSQQIAEGQARRSPYQSPQRVNNLMNQLGNEENRIGSDRAEAINSGNNLRAGEPPARMQAMSLGTPLPSRMPPMTPQERQAVSRRMVERPWEDPYHAGGYSAGERAAGLPQSIENNARANARLRQGIAQQNGQMVNERVNARLAGRQRIAQAASNAIRRAAPPPWMQNQQQAPQQQGPFQQFNAFGQGIPGPGMNQPQGNPSDAPHKDKYGRDVLPRSELGDANTELTPQLKAARKRAWRDAYERARKEHGGWPGWMGIGPWGDMDKNIREGVNEEMGFNEEGNHYGPVRESKSLSIPREVYANPSDPTPVRLRFSRLAKEYDPFESWKTEDEFDHAVNQAAYDSAQKYRARLTRGIGQR